MRSPDPGFSHSLAGQPAAPGRNPGDMFLPGGWQEKFTAQLLPKWSFSGSQPPAPEPGEGTRKQPPSCHRSEVCANGSALTPVFNKLKMLLEYFYNWSVHTFVLSSARLVFLQPRFPAAGFAGAFFLLLLLIPWLVGFLSQLFCHAPAVCRSRFPELFGDPAFVSDVSCTILH